MTTTGEEVGGKTPLFGNGKDVRTLVQGTRDTDFRFLSFKPTNHTSHLLVDNLTLRISDRNDSAVTLKITQHSWAKEKRSRKNLAPWGNDHSSY